MFHGIFHDLVDENANELTHMPSKTSTSTISTRGHRLKRQTSQTRRDVANNLFFLQSNRTETRTHFLVLLLQVTPLFT